MIAPGRWRWIRLRMLLVALLVLGLFGLAGFKAYTLQAVEGERLRQMAEQQYLKEIELPPRRGSILDRHGTQLAVSVEVESIYANPRVLRGRAAAVSRQLAEALHLDPWKLQKRLSSDRYFAWVKRRVSPKEASQVRALKIRGVALTKESRRFYPNHGLGSTVVGFAGADARGLEGLELRYDQHLRGTPGRVAGLRDALGRQVFSEGVAGSDPTSHDLRLTLDKFIQHETELALAEAYPTVKPESGWIAAVVLDPRTGDVLAMANAPSYDPNRYGKVKPARWRNRVIADTFEPGSTMKIFTVAAALELGVVQRGEVIDCEKGRYRIGHNTIHDSHRNDKLTLTGVLKKSSNIAVSKIAFRLGKERLHSALTRYGFGQETGVNLPGERRGVLRAPKRWSDVGLANIAFGQGMTTSTLQLTQAMGAVANGGVLMQPRVVQGVYDAQGKPIKELSSAGRRIMPQQVADALLEMLVSVTEPGGTGVQAALERYSVAGKTGTAQKVDPVTRTYSKDRWLSSFMGAVPASDPRLVITVIVNEPDGEKYYGGEVAGPIFRRIAERSLAYLGVKPDKAPRPLEEKKRRMPRPAPVLAADGYVDEEPPPLPGSGWGSGSVLVPDFTGMSIAEVISEARKSALQLEVLGSGRATAQSPGPGPTSRQTLVRVSFRPPG